MFNRIRSVLSRFRDYKRTALVRSDLDVLLIEASEQKSLDEKLRWLVRLLAWIRYEKSADKAIEKETGRIPTARLRFLLMVLDRNPEWKKEVAKILRVTISQVSGLELFTETGLPHDIGLLGEMWDRFIKKFLPDPPLEEDLGHLFWALFPDEKDPAWVASIDNATFEKLVELFFFEIDSAEGDWNRLRLDLEDALLYMVIQTRAIGLEPAIRHRLDNSHFRQSAFYKLVGGMEEFLTALHDAESEVFFERASRFRLLIWECRREINQVYKHLDEYGVSVGIVFQIARLNSFLKRIDSLVEILINEKPEAKKVLTFIAQIIFDNQGLKRISNLLAQNISMLSRKVVERAAETGEHYITRTKAEYRRMVQAAGGGGVITAFTVYAKVAILSLGMSAFFEGFFSSFNYALSFVIIHLAGFTLGTKQPAMTAPALAAKMSDVNTEAGMEDLVDEITYIIRSQAASIIGNVMFVVPTALLIDLLFSMVFGSHIMSPEKAHYAFHSVDIVGPSFIYAAFTGILLWLSSLAAGWSDNFFAFYGLRKSLSRSPSLRAALGKVGARKVALFFEKNMSGLAGNISLGILLGMSPEVLKFVGFPLDVRHVTLSSGTLGGALPVLGFNIVYTGFFWRAVAGVFIIGSLNVAVSFGLALYIAIRARNINTPQQRAIYRAVSKRFLSRPLTFLLPIGDRKEPASHGHG
jgi:site-specific recombinase